ncbi:MAG: Uma2 family endonuclease [Longimicrobiales bacterium]
MSTQPNSRITPAEYLDAERRAETKSEYYAGEVFAMAGASQAHNLIVTNLIVALGTQVRGSACRVYPGDMRVKVESTGLYTYPDVAVVCGKADLEDEHFDTLLNPILLIEVLSASTERYDRGNKAEHYRRLATLRELLLITQNEPQVARYRRQGERDWLLTEFRDLDESVELTAIDCMLTLRDIYDGILPGQ